MVESIRGVLEFPAVDGISNQFQLREQCILLLLIQFSPTDGNFVLEPLQFLDDAAQGCLGG